MEVIILWFFCLDLAIYLLFICVNLSNYKILLWEEKKKNPTFSSICDFEPFLSVYLEDNYGSTCNYVSFVRYIKVCLSNFLIFYFCSVISPLPTLVFFLKKKFSGILLINDFKNVLDLIILRYKANRWSDKRSWIRCLCSHRIYIGKLCSSAINFI